MAARLTGTIRKQNFIDLFFLVKERGGGLVIHQHRYSIKTDWRFVFVSVQPIFLPRWKFSC